MGANLGLDAMPVVLHGCVILNLAGDIVKYSSARFSTSVAIYAIVVHMCTVRVLVLGSSRFEKRIVCST